MNKTLLLLCCILFQCLSVMAQGSEWKTSQSKDGKIEVKHRFITELDSNRKEALIIEDVTKITDNLDFNKCITLMKDVTRHKEFTGDKISKKIKDLSDSECIVYYYSKNPWPIANSDCVAIMTDHIDIINREAEFILIANPNEYPMGKVNRMTNYNVSYSFKDLGDGLVEIIIKGRTSPPVKVPFWVIKSAFPKAPEKGIRRLSTLIKQ